MKKFLFLLTMLIVFVLTACADPEPDVVDRGLESDVVDSESEPEAFDSEADSEDVDDDSESEVINNESEPEIIDERSYEEIIIADLLYDFDYLIAIIEESTPLIGPIERSLNIDFWEEMDQIRSNIAADLDFGYAGTFEEMQYLAAQFFYNNILLNISWAVWFLGHLGPTSQDALVDHFARIQRYVLYADEVSLLGHLYYEIYNSDIVSRFYDIDEICLETDGLGEFDENNIITNIIVENEIAYVSIASFMNNIEFDSETLLPFFQEIQDYDHLIIDIRGNFGGYMTHFTNLFMATLSDDVQVVSYPEFFRSTDLVHYNVEAYIDSFRIHEGFNGTFISADEFFNYNPMPYMNYDDRELLDYVVEWELMIEPREDNIPFNGQIWLLVDGLSSSASENAAIFSMSSGFATVVGRETFGVLGAITIMTPLPNTGIIFRVDVGYIPDENGFSQEEFGVSPQYVVPAGQDILEYVLGMIRN